MKCYILTKNSYGSFTLTSPNMYCNLYFKFWQATPIQEEVNTYISWEIMTSFYMEIACGFFFFYTSKNVRGYFRRSSVIEQAIYEDMVR